MYLEKIELHGFKSFAKKTELTFPHRDASNQGITVIVGPNGSGKSNIADAVRWVLGEQSVKQLRGKKSHDVIFSGSDTKTRMGFAEVSLYLNNKNHEVGLDYDEIIITRRISRDGEGEYLLNKQKVRLADIQMLLAKANFGQKTYSVVGQGMADAVLSASLQERKEFFDEAVGVKQYQIKRHEALNKFQRTRENLGQTDLTLKELEPQLRSLTRQVKKLAKREEIEKELHQVQSEYYAYILNDLNQNIKQYDYEKNVLTKKDGDLKEQSSAIEKKMDEFSRDDSRQALFNSLQQDYQLSVHKRNELLREEALLKSQIDIEFQKAGKSNIVWLEKKRGEISASLSHIESSIAQLESALVTDTHTKEKRERDREQLDKRLKNVREEVEKLKLITLERPFDQDSELKEIFERQQSLVDELVNVAELSQLEKIKIKARELAQKFSLYIDRLKKGPQKEKEQLTAQQTQLEQLVQQKNQITVDITAIEGMIRQKEDKIRDLKQSIVDKETEITKIDTEINLASAETPQEASEKIQRELDKIAKTLETVNAEIEEKNIKIQEFNKDEQGKKEKLISLQKEYSKMQHEISVIANQVNSVDIELTKYQTRKEDTLRDIEEQGLDRMHISKVAVEEDFDKHSAFESIQQLKKQLDIIGGIDEETQKEYEEVNSRYTFLSEQAQDLEEAILKLEKVIEELDEQIKKQFDRAFNEINKEFQKFFKILFDGGKAELVKVTAKEIAETEAEMAEEITEEGGIVVEEEALEKADKFLKRLKKREKESYGGIEIKAVPPGKKMASIAMLSGGERALTSIALISAIIANNPAPFVVLDEMDAALDEANAMRFAQILEDLSHKTQFIAITHTRATMMKADVIYGVTMKGDGVSQLLSVKLQDADKVIEERAK